MFDSASDSIEFRMPMPPSINRFYFNNPKSGRGRIKTTEARVWEKEALLSCRRYFNGRRCVRFQQWGLDLQFGFARSRIWRCDMNNFYKASIDMLCQLTGLDDRYCIAERYVKVLTDCDQIVGTLYLLPSLDSDLARGVKV